MPISDGKHDKNQVMTIQKKEDFSSSFKSL